MCVNDLDIDRLYQKYIEELEKRITELENEVKRALAVVYGSYSTVDFDPNLNPPSNGDEA